LSIDPRRQAALAAAVAAYNLANLREPLPRNAMRLLAVMFPDSDTCHRSLEALVAEGFTRRNLPGTLRRLVAAGLLSKQRGSASIPDTYRLHLPPPEAAITPRRRDIEAAIAAHNSSTDPDTLLLSPRTVHLLTIMFADADVCQRTLDSLVREGFNGAALLRVLKALSEAGIISKQRGGPNIYRLHLPPRRQP
jgi:hypothetical protein